MKGIQNIFQKLLVVLSPLLGTGAVGVCPLCWAGSAAFLSYVGLGVLIPVWRIIALSFLILGLIGFILDYRRHKNILPLILLIVGGITLFVGRYVFVVRPTLHVFSDLEGFAGWPIWGIGGIFIIVAVFYNRSLFKNPKHL